MVGVAAEEKTKWVWFSLGRSVGVYTCVPLYEKIHAVIDSLRVEEDGMGFEVLREKLQ